MIEEIDSETYIKHYFQKVLVELKDDPGSFLTAAFDFVNQNTNFFSRKDCAPVLMNLLPQSASEGLRVAAGHQSPHIKSGDHAPDLADDQAVLSTVQLNTKSGQAECHSRGGPSEASLMSEEVKQEESPSQAVEDSISKVLRPTAGNGADLDKYSWTQSLQECIITVPVPFGTKARMCDVQITLKNLRIGIKGQSPILDGELFSSVKPDDCLWNILDGKLLEVTLQKADSMQWWRCVVKGEPEIDVQGVEPESSKLSDLDPEMRATVEKMMYDQRQKAMGLPTSEEQHKHEVMKKFMAAHPEMDFSNAKFM